MKEGEMDIRSPSCIRVAVSLPVRGTFFYRVPGDLGSMVRVGSRVTVPFGSRKVTGYVLERVPRVPDRDLREIIDLLDIEPLFQEQMVPFFEWLAEYYIHPLGMVIRAALPEERFKTARLTKKGLDLLHGRLFTSEETAILSWLKDNQGKKLPWPFKKLYTFQEKGWITVESRTRKGMDSGPRLLRFIRPKKGLDLEAALDRRGESSKAANELEFLELIFQSEAILSGELRSRFPNGAYLIRKWTGKGVLEIQSVPIHHGEGGMNILPPLGPHPLHEHQRLAVDQISQGLNRCLFSPFLLYGITGSGKTEVYCRVVEHAIKSGRRAIVMAPEISLSVYLEGVFRSRMGDRVAVYHSGLSAGERFRQWIRMMRGEVDLVIGARSALFAPLPDLGLIIVDEEHDPAYVQEETRGVPHYQARDAAVKRAEMERAVVVLGSGTPSVQSYQNGITGKYHLLLMPHRVEKRPLPHMEIVDMKGVKDAYGRDEMLSPRLRMAVHENLEKGRQSILFLNRRGFHRLYLCRSCGRSVCCPHCDVALTFHLDENRLICHYCGFTSGTRVTCSSCGAHNLKPYGFGTEKLEQELNTLFPGARIARMDADSTRRKGSALQILNRFGRRETDILVGTQMITKGYDFPHVTVVGVIAADLSLNFPDFRAGERTFQLLSQVAGRAGRGDQMGRVIIQTFTPDHYVIRSAVAHDFQSFFDMETRLRKDLGYPPFSSLACLRLQGEDREKTAEAVRLLSSNLRAILGRWPERGKEIQVLGPVEAPISRLKGKHRWQLLIKSRSASLLRHLIMEVEKTSLKALRSRGVHLVSDVDPYNML
ncbi:MAG: primosomal protein N' [Deltaproteobacteria bacterium]|nr:primosomal protein N' [Deltaproteobacteria bacterium]MBW2111829.1 primosomal protein N' [Deltaproteobacteria bacterium]MBW2354105.1 primosomal protein N' [Deltaproteobacteria bacterium]